MLSLCMLMKMKRKMLSTLANELRMSGFVVETEYTGRSLKSQFKRAD